MSESRAGDTVELEELDRAGLEAIIASEARGVLVDFWSPWCAPCRTMRPHLRRMAAERAERWRFVAVNAADQEDAAQAFGVRALPTIVFFKGGAETDRFAGAAAISSIDAKLDELG